jgi:FlaA1/EpsC-like NDP-sugar epimerase
MSYLDVEKEDKATTNFNEGYMRKNNEIYNALLDRDVSLFHADFIRYEGQISKIIAESKFLVLGAGGTIGRAVSKAIFQHSPLKLHLVDLSENNLAELVRDLRSSNANPKGEFKTFAIDVGSIEFEALYESDGDYDYVINLSALKHVRSERDPYTLMRMLQHNVLNTKKTLQLAIEGGAKKYFSVSTDKATNPQNLMGASKAIMESIMMHYSDRITISSARFANVLFSDGSLLNSFENRLKKHQPLTAPFDIKRFFISEQEAGELCLLSAMLTHNREIIFPKLTDKFYPLSFHELAIKYLQAQGLNALVFDNEADARNYSKQSIPGDEWPCFWSTTDTTGEKVLEEFFSTDELIDYQRFDSIGVITLQPQNYHEKIVNFESKIQYFLKQRSWSKSDLVGIITDFINDMDHIELNKSLDDKM